MAPKPSAANVSEPEPRRDGPPAAEATPEQGLLERVRGRVATETERARSAGDQHVTVAVPFRAAERTQRVAAGVLAGGVAYRLFLWLLPVGLILGGVLGLGDADGIDDAVAEGGLPAAVVDAIGDVARAGDGNWWWLLAIGVPLLLWEGYTGAKALQLVHGLVWNDPPPRTKPLTSSLVFTGVCLVFVAAISLTWWFRDESLAVGLPTLALMVAPLGAVWLWVSLQLPHGTATWKALLPGALLVAGGFQLLHGALVYLLLPKLEKATSLYGGLGVVATMLFFAYLVGRIVVTAPILNSSLHDELRRQSREKHDVSPIPPDRTGGACRAGDSTTRP
jgi:uncharacterized BrkB/YihY/UPF0761 family membrane protein